MTSGRTMRALVVLGTRPEAIKCMPLIHGLRQQPDVDVRICVTGQHRQMLDDILIPFGIYPDDDLDIMTAGQTLTEVTANVLARLPAVLAEAAPDWLLVQGDTNTTFAAALAAFYARVPVAHVEAGLRSHDVHAPWPEEVNRRFVSMVADLHFAPTERARQELLREGVPAARVHVTGNTVIDALIHARDRLAAEPALRRSVEAELPPLDSERRLILVTSHRRESFDGGIEAICAALLELAGRGDVQIVYPVHPNPNVRAPVERMLASQPRICLLAPQRYLPFVALMSRAVLILSDSGGIQEEAPALGKPVLVLRTTTERPEAIEAGTAQLVGTETAAIVTAASRLLDDPVAHAAMSQARNPFGDGHAADRIIRVLLGEGRRQP